MQTETKSKKALGKKIKKPIAAIPSHSSINVDVEVENIPKVLHAMFEPLLVLSSCSRMRKDKSKKFGLYSVRRVT